MDKWETLEKHIDQALIEIAEELKGKVKEARDDALVDELAKISTAIGRMNERISKIEEKLVEDDD